MSMSIKKMYAEVTGYCMHKFFWKQIFSSKIIVKSKKSIWLHWNVFKPSLCNFNNFPSSQHTAIKHSRFTTGLDKLNYSLLPQEAPKEVEKHIFLNVAMKTTGSMEQYDKDLHIIIIHIITVIFVYCPKLKFAFRFKNIRNL